jgi:hypothetical protein
LRWVTSQERTAAGGRLQFLNRCFILQHV